MSSTTLVVSRYCFLLLRPAASPPYKIACLLLHAGRLKGCAVPLIGLPVRSAMVYVGSAAGVVKIAGAASYLVSAILGPTRQLFAFFKLSVGSCPQRVEALLL